MMRMDIPSPPKPTITDSFVDVDIADGPVFLYACRKAWRASWLTWT